MVSTLLQALLYEVGEGTSRYKGADSNYSSIRPAKMLMFLLRIRRLRNDGPNGTDGWSGSSCTIDGCRPEFASPVHSGDRGYHCYDSTLDRRSFVGSKRMGSG